MIFDNKTPGWVVTPGETGWVCGKIHSDGSMTAYKFQTQEWAELCKRSMDRMDSWSDHRAWSISASSITYGVQGTLTANLRELTMTQFELAGKRILELDHNRDVVRFDVPAIIYLWLKTTWIPKAWKRLMWGDKGTK